MAGDQRMSELTFVYARAVVLSQAKRTVPRASPSIEGRPSIDGQALLGVPSQGMGL